MKLKTTSYRCTRVRTKFWIKPVNIKTYIHKIGKLLNNLITNAIQSIPSERQGNVDVCIRGVNAGIILRVADNGIGISEEIGHKIFNPSFTTKSTGTGLGLAMVKNIVTQSGGRVFFWSKVNKGASFYLDFPKD